MTTLKYEENSTQFLLWRTFIVLHSVAHMTEIVVKHAKEECARARSSNPHSFLTSALLAGQGVKWVADQSINQTLFIQHSKTSNTANKPK